MLQVLEVPDAIEVGFSPGGTFTLTWQRPKKDEASGNFGPNLKIWETATGKHIESFLQKQQGEWSLQYSFDEKYCARLVTNKLIQFYESRNLHTPWTKLEVDAGIGQFSLSPGQNYSVAVFVPEKSGRPASVRVYQIPNFAQPVSQKTFFKAEKVSMKWNSLGTALLVLSSTEVDRSGKSYYGETNLYLLGIAGSYDSRIQLDKEGTIHDFAWSPNSREFGVTYGYMPSKTTIFDARGNTVHSFPVSSRNTLMFSPHGRWVLVAGFGNLQGQVDIYDRQKQFSKVCSIEASNTSYCEWSPDGQYLLTATTSPRLRVDNGVKIWHVTGKLMYTSEYDELLAVNWRPQASSLYPLKSTIDPAPEPHASAANQPVKKTSSDKPAGAYRPPHARSSGASSAPTPLFQRLATPGSGVPGATATTEDNSLSKSAAKNKKKREAKKAKETTGSSLPVEAAASTSSPSSSTDNVPTGSGPEDKKIRSLLKKLRAIEELKARRSNGDKLEDTQVQKINNEASIRKDLAFFGWVQ